jgi:hypothetical protein
VAVTTAASALGNFLGQRESYIHNTYFDYPPLVKSEFRF